MPALWLVALLGLAACGVLAACGTVPSAHALESAEFGARPGGGHRDEIRAAFAELLLDPDSARFEYGSPEKGWGSSWIGFVYGWVVWTRVNSKNQYGAFTGWQTYKVLTVDGAIHSIYEVHGDDKNRQFRRVR